MDLFTWNQEETDVEILSLINRRRRQVLVHSYLYYQLNETLVEDSVFDSWCRELTQLQGDYPDLAEQGFKPEVFRGFVGVSGFDLPYRDAWVVGAAYMLLRNPHVAAERETKKEMKILHGRTIS